ncbi:MAG TPA: helix-turn-helix transcriptional regulator [Flavitalea sp.]|nr:helix-turn-helix transcriptional regulator [Flavitalea sp.]
MISQGHLIRMTNRVTAFLNQYVNVAGIKHKEEMIYLFNRIHQLFPNWVIMTCPAQHQDIHYVSKNSHTIYGKQSDLTSSDQIIHRYFASVHDADKADVLDCIEFLHDYLDNVPPDEHYLYRAILHYRHRKENGQYIYLHDEKAVLRLGDSENLYFTLVRDITGEKPFGGVKVEILKQDEHIQKIAEYHSRKEKASLTKREHELVTLIQQGLSTKEIAWHLNISHNTVRNIKSRMFEKFKVNNAIELLNMTA